MSQSNTTPTLPPALLHAISSRGGGRVVLVLGAGCSYEAPTSLPLSGDLSADCHRKLTQDGILNSGEVGDHRDLSAVAEAVFCRTGSQEELIRRFPSDAFRNARPNEGYKIMAALLLEGAVADVLTLNFDHAARHALADLGAREEVSTISGPEDHAKLGARNLIYLHRDIDCSPDDLILRAVDLESAWQDRWEEVVAQRVLSGPVTVFVGLGSPAKVLTSTTKHILESLGSEHTDIFLVDPSAHDESYFAGELNIPEEDYICMGWGDFMGRLSKRVVEEQRAAIEKACDELGRELNIEEEDVSDLSHRLAATGLLRLGRLRAAWMSKDGSYLPHEPSILNLLGNLLLGVRTLERLSGHQADFVEDGIVEFTKESHVARVMVRSGGGWMNEARMKLELKNRQREFRQQGKQWSTALVGGVEGSIDTSAPNDIIADTNPHDLIEGPDQLIVVGIAQLRDNPALVHEVIQ